MDAKKYAIFDMDGLIFDTELIAKFAWAESLTHHGYTLSDRIFEQFIGRDMSWRQHVLEKEFGCDFPFESIKNMRIEVGDKYEVEVGLPMKLGIRSILPRLAEKDIRIGLATGTAKERVLRRLKQADILDYFDVIVTSADVPRGKPFPDVYLETLTRMRASADAAIVFEDSMAGVDAATAAGIRTVLIPDLEATTADAKQKAFRIFQSMDEASRHLDEVLMV